MDIQLCSQCETTNPAYARFCENCKNDLLAPDPVSNDRANAPLGAVPGKSMNRILYIGAYLAVSVISIFISFGARGGNYSSFQFLIPLLLFGLFHIVFTWNIWAAIDDGETNITPAKAVGYHFIPLFNILWTGLVILAFPDAYNRFIERHNIPTFKLNSGIYTIYFVLVLLGFCSIYVPILAYPLIFQPFIYTALIFSACGAVNRLADGGENSAVESALGLNLSAAESISNKRN